MTLNILLFVAADFEHLYSCCFSQTLFERDIETSFFIKQTAVDEFHLQLEDLTNTL